MAEDQKDLQHLIDNPQDLDITDTAKVEEIAKELAALEGPRAAESAPEVKPAEAPPATPPAAPVAPAPAAPAVKLPEAKEGEASVVLAPDGKSTIPYAVLKGEREARAHAEGVATELAGTVSALEARIKALEAGEQPKVEEGRSAADIEAELAKLEEEAPVVAESMRKVVTPLLESLKAMEAKVASLNERSEQADADFEAQVKSDIVKAIDNIPALVHWRANNPPLWEEAKAFDEMLRNRPEWADKTFDERFTHVVKLVVANHDESILPAGPVAKPSTEEVMKAAEAKLRNAAAPAVKTLTDMPPGAAPEQDEREKLESISVTDLHKKFASMTPQQIQEYTRTAFSP